jgi:non-specific serine/threonine protein kinase
MFRRLSVFASRFTPATAEAVVSEIESGTGNRHSSTTDSVEFLDLFASLADKNLLVRRRSEDGEVSFRLLEIVREYAVAVLETDDDADEIRRRHAEFFLALTQKAEPNLLKRDSAIWVSRLEQEHDNLRAALQWSVKNDPQIAARLAAAIRQFWSIRGHLNEGIGWAQQILGLGVEFPPAIEWKLLTLSGNFSQFRGDTVRAQDFYERSLSAARREGEKAHIAQALRGLGAMAYLNLDLEKARTIINEAIEISREIGDDFGLAAALARLGDISSVSGDRKTAIELTKESLSIFRRIGYLEGISAKLYNLGSFVFLEGDFDAARSYFEEAYETTQELNEKINTRLIFDGFAALATEEGDYAHAARLAGAAESFGATIGYFVEPGERLVRDAYLGRLRSAMSVEEFEAELAAGRKLTDTEAKDLILSKRTERRDREKTSSIRNLDGSPEMHRVKFSRTAFILVILILALIALILIALWTFRQ